MIAVTGTPPAGRHALVDGMGGSVPEYVSTIAANSVLPAHRRDIELRTSDGLRLVGELATPVDGPVAGTIVCVHPLPTHGGMMDSHLLRKAAWRLPALASLAVLRFNTRGTSSARGTSEGSFDEARGEGLDLRAAIEFVVAENLPNPWLLGWSFGTDVIIKHGNIDPVRGAVLMSPPLRFSDATELEAWAGPGRPLVAVVPALDDYLQPEQARRRFAAVPQAQVVAVPDAGHLWVGEKYVRIALDHVVHAVNPDAAPLPTEWNGPMERWSDL